MKIANGMPADRITGVTWQKGSASLGDGNCVEVAGLPGGDIAMRNSRFPDGPALVFTSSELKAFIVGAKATEFDHLIG
ncbi:DUF397 domain-containing protein [Streptomyces cucumeris]|uniref:DUF397 domain-containing protein n=1 Tax=Streptomyces cucumeris TaxID=2962890 RepID=UPI0020C8EA17|nr:DUF397 domain-containing protein [Streptomyces sp. NEAU-Y11]MCP9213110.1 DUF397 domain-containing protein [Streptomyces sp. NEAU-Y11]